MGKDDPACKQDIIKVKLYCYIDLIFLKVEDRSVPKFNAHERSLIQNLAASLMVGLIVLVTK